MQNQICHLFLCMDRGGSLATGRSAQQCGVRVVGIAWDPTSSLHGMLLLALTSAANGMSVCEAQGLRSEQGSDLQNASVKKIIITMLKVGPSAVNGCAELFAPLCPPEDKLLY